MDHAPPTLVAARGILALNRYQSQQHLNIANLAREEECF